MVHDTIDDAERALRRWPSPSGGALAQVGAAVLMP
jgi:hypothetical protein